MARTDLTKTTAPGSYANAGVAVTMMWGWIFNSDYGLINYVLSLFGLEGPRWLADKNIAMVSIVIMCLWSIGNSILIMLEVEGSDNMASRASNCRLPTSPQAKSKG